MSFVYFKIFTHIVSHRDHGITLPNAMHLCNHEYVQVAYYFLGTLRQSSSTSHYTVLIYLRFAADFSYLIIYNYTNLLTFKIPYLFMKAFRYPDNTVIFSHLADTTYELKFSQLHCYITLYIL